VSRRPSAAASRPRPDAEEAPAQVDTHHQIPVGHGDDDAGALGDEGAGMRRALAARRR
jgi:hypothetical protein